MLATPGATILPSMLSISFATTVLATPRVFIIPTSILQLGFSSLAACSQQGLLSFDSF